MFLPLAASMAMPKVKLLNSSKAVSAKTKLRSINSTASMVPTKFLPITANTANKVANRIQSLRM